MRRGGLVRSGLVAIFLVSATVLAQAPDPQLQRYYQEGEKALSEGRYADAEAAYTKLHDLSPGIAEVCARLGLIYYQERKYEKAVSVLRQGLKLKPALPNADILLAMSLSELGRYPEALPGLQKAFGNSTDPALKRMSGLQLQRAYTGLKQDAKAVEIALQLSRMYPDDPEVLYHTGKLFGNYAYLSMRRLTDVAPESAWRHLAAGEVHESQGEYELAVAEYRIVLTIDPRRSAIHQRIGRAILMSKQGDFRAEAAKEFEQELDADPTNANAAYELGEIRRKEGSLANARALFETAVKYDPEFAEAHVGLGRVLLAAHEPEPALAHLKRAATLSPGDSVTYFHLAQAYKAVGNAPEQQRALAEFRRLRNEERGDRQIGPSTRDVTKQEADANAP